MAQELDVVVNVVRDKVLFDGLPDELAYNMEASFEFEEKRDFPDICLYLLFQA